MRTLNLRVKSPAKKIRAEVESSASRAETTLTEALGKALQEELNMQDNQTVEGMVRVKSVVFRSNGVLLGEQEVTAFGRDYYAMFGSNSYVASVNADGHELANWRNFAIKYDTTLGNEYFLTTINENTNDAGLGKETAWDEDIEAEAGITIVVNFEVVINRFH